MEKVAKVCMGMQKLEYGDTSFNMAGFTLDWFGVEYNVSCSAPLAAVDVAIDHV